MVVVTRAAALPRLETIRLLRRLDALGLTVSALIVNALTPAGPRRAAAARTEARGGAPAARGGPARAARIARAAGAGRRAPPPGA